MRTASEWVMVTAVALSVAGIASAQNPGGGGRGGRGGQGRGGMMGGGGASIAMLLGNEGVQKEIKLTEEQKTKVKDFTDAQAKKRQELTADGQPDREKMQEFMKESNEAGEKFVKDNLNADQQKRVKQIQYQAMGLRAFSNEDVAKALKLTDDQKEKIKGLSEEMQKDMQELRQGGFNQESMQKMRTLTKEYMVKASDTLNADQKKEWKDLTGDPFELQMQQGRGGRGGAGGRRGGNNPPPPV
jgi:Spy/CpxP family protein refolding chaperone